MNIKIKFPSLGQILSSANSVLIRFPGAVILTVIATVSLMYLVSEFNPGWVLETQIVNIAIIAGVGLPLLLGIGLMDRFGTSISRNYLMQFAALICLGIYYYFLPANLNFSDIARLALLSISFHMFVAFSPFFEKKEHPAFWSYNQRLFIRILLSTLYSGTLYLGLVLALVACDQLLGFHIRDKSYMNLFIFMAGIFHPWYFMAGMPDKQNSQLEIDPYPGGLKIFTQFVLLPLVTVYLLILYVYTFKILLTGVWPVGWVSYLVIGFSVAGILSLLLIHPISGEDGNAWIKTYSKWFYAALFPLLIMLAFAIGKRVADYGITEKRYFVIVIAAWLFCISIYYLSKRNRPVRTIPMSLSIIALLCSFGPWGAFEVSKKSQLNRLISILEFSGKFENGKIQDLENVDTSIKSDVAGILEYLIENHGVGSVESLLSFNVDSLIADKDIKSRHEAYPILKKLGLDPSDLYESTENSNYEYLGVLQDVVKEVKGFDYAIKYDFYNSFGVVEKELEIGNEKLMVKVYRNPPIMVLEIGGSKKGIELKPYIKEWSKLKTDENNLPENSMVINTEFDKYKVKIDFENMNLEKKSDKVELESCSFTLYLSVSENK